MANGKSGTTSGTTAQLVRWHIATTLPALKCFAGSATTEAVAKNKARLMSANTAAMSALTLKRRELWEQC
jgi:hypothetical protein